MAPARVLVVDDEKVARNALETILASEGYDVRGAADGDQALGLIRAFEPDVVLSDYHMPGIDGVSLLKKARASGCSAVFVLMTGVAKVEVVVDAIRAGAENFLIKPLDVDTVLDILHNAIEKHLLEQAPVEHASPHCQGCSQAIGNQHQLLLRYFGKYGANDEQPQTD